MQHPIAGLEPIEPAQLSYEDALAEMARMGLMPISGGDGSGEGEGDGEGDPPGGDDNGDGDDGAAKALKSERDARKSAEKAVKDLQKQLDDLNAKDQSELERTKGELSKLTKQLEDATTKARDTTARNALMAEAAKANAIKPDVVEELCRAKVEFDDEGEPTNVVQLIQDAKKRAPELFRSSQGGGGNGGARDQEEGDKGAYGVGRLRNAYNESSKRKR